MAIRIFTAAATLALAIGVGASAMAQSPAVELTGDVKVVRQVTIDGKTSETMEEPNQVLPGDRLVFSTRYKNNGKDPATDFVVTNPLPQPVKLTKAEGFEVSVDGGKAFGALAALKAAGEDGKPRAAGLADVTHVRWRLASIAPGASGEVRYFAEVR